MLEAVEMCHVDVAAARPPEAIYHGKGLRGLGNVPRITGPHPIYVARQFIHFKEGTRNGVDAALMKKTTAGLTDDDIIDLSAYVGSLPR